jgi:MOSC domain-containing protein YiiM
MRVLSVNVAQPREVETPRGIVLTSIFKEPVAGRVAVRANQLAGDSQSDLRVHGGPNKAVYAYASEHYQYWQSALHRKLEPGSFGENLTTEGLLESQVRIGDLYRVGTALLRVTQPRMPCFKLALRFALPSMVKLFWKSNLSGIYFSVAQEGGIAAGDAIELLESDPSGVTVAEVLHVYKGEDDDKDLLQRLLAAPLKGSWKQDIQESRNV